MPDPIPAEAVQTAAEFLCRVFGAEHLSWVDFEGQAREILEPVAPVLAAQARADERRKTAEQIAAAIRERGLEQALDCWCHDTYADLARQIGEARDA